MNNPSKPLHLFEGYGVELEYMIVHADTLQVAPLADKLIYDEAGAYVSDVEFGDIAWSNELVLHVVELKTQGPVKSLAGLYLRFQEHVRKINRMLAKYNACLLPSGAHPLMNPFTETRLWPHEHNAVYEAYNRVFDCRGHGWANLQSTHLNLPFSGDEEFEKLHAAIRLVLPLIPALSASSPILDGNISGYQDTRLEVYRHNQDKIPRVAGKIIPEAVFSRQAYEQQILQPIYNDMAPYDPEGILQDEFLNSRGAIARFSRNAIEIRLLDIQECPLADIAVLQLVVAVIQALAAERWVSIDELKQWDENRLATVLLGVIKDGQETVLTDKEFVRCFGFSDNAHTTAGTLWNHLAAQLPDLNGQPEVAQALDTILTRGNLSKRILEAVGTNPSEAAIRQVYRQLAVCLSEGKMFIPEKVC
ncbi:glutamate--cysteine ligase [Pontibacter sp. 172403-2]|uniref:carboxylate-amine ligase n=1 Tax=Pontibacter rufus TaxID=2791028 RepID=UPI0018B008EC|nr:glutamate-cysteine ligase family protein [Pontibacter sp. 172403-2]MBF9253597.1 glutamate--cysteine ligase [Pontibacter sp. 172403-2]